MAMVLREARREDLDALARIWFDGWQDAHAEILPDVLRRLRTLASFRERLEAGLSDVRVAEQAGSLFGFAMLRGDELYQFYVLAQARGGGVALMLMDDAINRLRATGHQCGWLACAIGNERARRFYEKTGWRLAGVMTSRLPTADGVFQLDVWRFEINLRGGPALAVQPVA